MSDFVSTTIMTTIKICAPQHHSAIPSLILNIQQNEFGVPITLADQPDLLDIANFYQKGKGQFWVAENEAGEVDGTIALLDVGADFGTIRKMFVRADYRGKEHGVGQKLYETLERWAAAKGFKSLLLGTRDQLQAALRFYERNGFLPIPKENLPDTFPLMAVDNRFYIKTTMNSISKEIARHIREIHFGGNWTWSTMQEALKDVTWQQAVAPPANGANSIATLVFHMNFYLNVVRHRLAGTSEKFRHEDSFAMPEIQSEADWQALLTKTWTDAEAFAQAIEQFPDERLLEDVSPKHGSFYKNLHGVVEHNHYHLGQIVLLKKGGK